MKENAADAERIGKRIRAIRLEKGMSAKELSERVGLGPDRLNQYERSVRKPKKDMLKKIACCLNVSPSAIEDPTPDTAEGMIYTLFALEEKAGISPVKGEDGNVYLSTSDNNEFQQYLECWMVERENVKKHLNETDSQEEKDGIIADYRD